MSECLAPYNLEFLYYLPMTREYQRVVNEVMARMIRESTFRTTPLVQFLAYQLTYMRRYNTIDSRFCELPWSLADDERLFYRPRLLKRSPPLSDCRESRYRGRYTGPWQKGLHQPQFGAESGL